MNRKSEDERKAIKRTLKMINTLLDNFEESTLMAVGGGLMTYGEIRRHVKSAMNFDYLKPKNRKKK
jgi:hypothetical protein